MSIFTGGTFYGVQNGDISRTILGVMAKSEFGQNKDMISLFPITRIDAKLLKQYVMAVVNMLQDEGYIVKSVSKHEQANPYKRSVRGQNRRNQGSLEWPIE
ncbi:hypothetical protein TCAL_16739 [Tigriopus californicus]|uniref:Uncharacterized protein n=1 Tax=Tigriopus californicus TaxID=6832 RepID=A0A553PTR3_TIGCA|nr:hypothetical protein TCAL_16739 [Tigriopus californicus]